MTRARRAFPLERLRSRRGAVSAAVALSLLAGVALLPLAAMQGALPVRSSADYHLVRAVAPANQSVNLTIGTHGYTPTQVAVNATATVTFHVLNSGPSNQTFTIVDQNDTLLPVSDTPQALDQYCWKNCTKFANLTIAPGGWGTTTVQFPRPSSAAGDTYEFLSLTPWEYQAAAPFQFWGTITVNPATGPVYAKLFVNATDLLQFLPDVLNVPAGIPVVVEVGNQGIGHTFTVDEVSNDTGVTSSTNVGAYFATGCDVPTVHPTLVNSCVNTPNAYNPTPAFLPPKAGIYSFVCLIGGHFPNMWGHLYVGIAAQPAANVPQVQSVIQYGYLALAAVVIGGAAFLILMGQNERVVVATAKPQGP